MWIIPAIDLRAGRCVRLRQGDYDQETVFGEDPTAVAEHWAQRGARRLHLVDLDGARAGKPANLASVEGILARVSVPCQLGGGIRTSATVADMLARGIDRVIVGTRALSEPSWFEQLCRQFPGRVCLGLDARDGWVATDGWTAVTETRAEEVARRYDGWPLAAIIFTDISRDGMMQGVNADSIRGMRLAVRTPLIASGGVSSTEDIRMLRELGVEGCIVGRALYEGLLDLTEALNVAQDH